MAGHFPQLDRNALQRLRRTIKSMRRCQQHALPIRHILDLAADAPVDAGITIDFEASRELGHELIVVRLRERHNGSLADPRLEKLSRREREVAELIAVGFSNQLIANRLCIATSTVKDHVHHIFQKTGLLNRAAVAAACRAPLHD